MRDGSLSSHPDSDNRYRESRALAITTHTRKFTAKDAYIYAYDITKIIIILYYLEHLKMIVYIRNTFLSCY